MLVLDEINRTDLSAMLGPVFSLLEHDKRDDTHSIELAGQDGEAAARRVSLPPDLYIVGTMNEIDQSVESLDFALRRRFLWRHTPFSSEALLAIVAARWAGAVAAGEIRPKFTHEEAGDDLFRLAGRAAAMNAAIAAEPELGAQYEIGHAQFADVVFFVGRWLAGVKNRPTKGSFLWTTAGAPRPALDDLWAWSLRPLLEQYLAGSDARDAVVADLARTFLHGSD